MQLKIATLLLSSIFLGQHAIAQNLVANGYMNSSVANWKTPGEYYEACPMTWKAGPDAIGSVMSGYMQAVSTPSNQNRAGIVSQCILTVGINPKRDMRFEAYTKVVQGQISRMEAKWTAHKSGNCSSAFDDVVTSFKETYYDQNAVPKQWQKFAHRSAFPPGTASFSVAAEYKCLGPCTVAFDDFLLESFLFDSGFE